MRVLIIRTLIVRGYFFFYEAAVITQDESVVCVCLRRVTGVFLVRKSRRASLTAGRDPSLFIARLKRLFYLLISP